MVDSAGLRKSFFLCNIGGIDGEYGGSDRCDPAAIIASDHNEFCCDRFCISCTSLLVPSGFVAVGLTLAGMGNFPGSKLIYFPFSFSYWSMLTTAFNRHSHFGYVFLAVMLWLGFWVKLTAHLILDYPYAEPVGNFDGSPTA